VIRKVNYWLISCFRILVVAYVLVYWITYEMDSGRTLMKGVVTDIIPVIKADKTLNLEVKNALVRLVQALYDSAEKD
jgi:hypothetical protein